MFRKFITDFAVWLIAWLRANVGYDPLVTNLSSGTHSCPEPLTPRSDEPQAYGLKTNLPFLNLRCSPLQDRLSGLTTNIREMTATLKEKRPLR